MTEEKSIFGELYDSLFGKQMDMRIGSVLIAIMSTAMFMLAQPFGASCALINMGQNIYGWNVGNPKILDTVAMKCAMSIITVFIGAMAASLFAGQWSLKIAPKGELFKGLIGGTLMAFGAVMGKGCTLGSFFSGWAALSGGALFFALGLALGAFIAAKWLLFEMDRFPGISSGKSFNFSFGKDNKYLQPIVGLLLAIFALSFPFIFGYDNEVKADRVVVGFIVIGFFMGIVLQRSRWCVVRALREPWMTGDSKAAVAIIAGILTGMIGIGTYKFINGGDVAAVFVFPHFWLRAIIGGTIFGIGMTIAGGCAVGSVWRAGEGQAKLMIATASLIFFMPLISKYMMPGYLELLPDAIAEQKVFLPDYLGYGGAMALITGILGLWYWFVKWNDRTKKFAAI